MRRQRPSPEPERPSATGRPYRRDVLLYCCDPVEWVDRNGEPSAALLEAVESGNGRRSRGSTDEAQPCAGA